MFWRCCRQEELFPYEPHTAQSQAAQTDLILYLELPTAPSHSCMRPRALLTASHCKHPALLANPTYWQWRLI
jgi:hypothetical protein